jgi:hypothetical protein
MEEQLKLFSTNSAFRSLVISQLDFNIKVLGIEDAKEAFERALSVNYARYVAERLGFDVLHDDDIL